MLNLPVSLKWFTYHKQGENNLSCFNTIIFRLNVIKIETQTLLKKVSSFESLWFYDSSLFTIMFI